MDFLKQKVFIHDLVAKNLFSKDGMPPNCVLISR